MTNATTEEERFYALNDAAKEGLVLGKTEEARRYAEELLGLLPEFKGNWNYGNAVQDANLVLGRIAVQEGRLDDAKQLLIEAGSTPGSPQLDTFGPNMSLAMTFSEAARETSCWNTSNCAGVFGKWRTANLTNGRAR